MDLAPVIAMNFMCGKFFLNFSVLRRRVWTPGSTTGNASVYRSNRDFKQS